MSINTSFTITLSPQEMKFLDEYSGLKYPEAVEDLVREKMKQGTLPPALVTQIKSYSGDNESLRAIVPAPEEAGILRGHHKIENEADLIYDFLKRVVHHLTYQRLKDRMLGEKKDMSATSDIYKELEKHMADMPELARGTKTEWQLSRLKLFNGYLKSGMEPLAALELLDKVSPMSLSQGVSKIVLDPVAEQERSVKAFEERFGEVENGCIVIDWVKAETLLGDAIDKCSPYQVDRVRIVMNPNPMQPPSFRVDFKTVPVFKSPDPL